MTRLLTRPTLARRDAPCPRQGRSEQSLFEVGGMIPTARVQRGPSEAARCASKGIVPATPSPIFSTLLEYHEILEPNPGVKIQFGEKPRYSGLDQFSK